MPATLSRYKLDWQNGTQWANFPELGDIYTDEVTFYTVDGYRYDVSFDVGSGRRLGVLFVTVDQQDPHGYNQTMHYCLGQFYNNQGAMLFAQFALNHFIETETWSVCPSFQAVDYIEGEPHTLGGDEIVSELYTW
jgi:hypothetical protein